LNRFLLPLGVFALLVVVLAIGIKRAPEKGAIASPLIGRPAPAFNLPLLTDASRRFDSSTLRGRPYLLNVWATWCAECRVEHDVLLEIQRSGLVPIIGLDWQDEDAQALEWLRQLGNPYALVLVDRDSRAAIDWGVYGAPETFLVDAKGIVVYKHVGALSREVWTSELMPRLKDRRAMP
jgi:cytochrome c biogenesis protein CcmG, thiol:disulfide interchange protein DsbE